MRAGTSSSPSKIVNILFLLAALGCAAYYVALGVKVRFGQSLDFMWLVFAGILLARFAIVEYMIISGRPSPLPGVIIKLIHAGAALFTLSLIIIEAIIVSAFSQSAPDGLDYIIVLGAKVNGTEPGGALRNRIQAAAEYWLDNTDTLIVASGGQGEDEGISEAECIYEGLVSRGVDPGHIILEDKSTSTFENIKFSMEKLSGRGDAGDSGIGVVTNNFHLYRALKIANNAGGAKFYGINVPTSPISFPHYMLREYFGALHGFVTGNW